MTQAPDSQQALDQTQALIDRIEALVVNGMRIPLTSKVVIDEENLFELLDHLRAYLPVEIQQAQQVLQNQAHLLQEARSAAEKIVAATKEKTRQYLQEHELVKQAQKMAEDMQRATEAETKRQRYEADKYSEEVLADLEQKVSRALNLVQTGRQNLAQNIEQAAQKIGL
ncbi:MAG: hypothetical protein ACO1RX_09425 [Candidatus Sericytochromatia bacterium]